MKRPLLFGAGVAVLFAAAVSVEVFSWAQPSILPTFPSVTGYTDCGRDGALFALNAAEQYNPLDPASEQRRWGPCSGKAGDGCDDGAINPWGERRCILTESEAAVIKEALRWQLSGTCEPPDSTPFPPIQIVEDYGKVIGAFRTLRRQWESACFARPTPTPTPPRPTPTPVIEPSPTPTPTPACEECEECEQCPPPAVCRECDPYDRVAVPPEIAETMKWAPTWNSPTTNRLRRLKAVAAYLAGLADRLYVPSPITTSRIGTSIGPWDCDDSMPLCEQDKAAYRERYGLTREELP